MTSRSSNRHVHVAETIRAQIGHRALFMMGAKNLLAVSEGEGGLSFRTGRVAAGKANYVKIVVNAMDTYDITFGKISRSFKVLKEVKGAYAGDLHYLISEYTGLALSL